jgi:hypothetical protein
MSFIHCIARLNQAAGRKLSDKEVADIYERIHKAALDMKAGRTVAPKKPGGPIESVVQQAAHEAAAVMIQEAQFKQYQTGLQLTKMSARLRETVDMQQAGIKPLDSVDRTVFRNYDGKTDIASLEQQIMGLKSHYGAKLANVLDGLGGLFWADKTRTRNLVREILGEKTGDVEAAKAGKALTALTDETHANLREAGGVIGKLDEGYIPQGWWNQEIVARAGKKAYVDYMLPVLKKTQAKGKHYFDDAGRPWDDARISQFLGKAWETIATNGHANTEPGQFKGTGGVARRHAEHRQIHFPDADAVLDAWGKFGGKTVPEILSGHIDQMARDTALMQWGGPNPQQTYRTMQDTALKAEIMADPVHTGKLEGRAARMAGYFDYVSGKTDPIAHPRLHRFVANVLPINVMAKLGGAVWASVFGDKVMFEATRHMNNLPALQTWRTEVALLNPANVSERALLMRQGLMLDNLRGAMNRFGEEVGNAPLANKLAQIVMQITGMNLVNNARKGALGMVLFDAIGTELKAGKAFSALHASDARILKSYGITADDWAVWQKAKLQDIGHGNDTALTPEAISRISDADLAGMGKPATLRRDAIVKLLGAVNTEAEFGVVTPGMKERAQFHSLGHDKGIFGEVGKTILQFKSFPWTQFHRQLDAVSNMKTPYSKAAMTAGLIAATTLAGSMIIQTREILTGKDPRPMDDWRFWGAAFLQGGSMGMYGDFLFSGDKSRYGTGPLETMAGPTVGPLLEMAIVQPMKAIRGQMEGKDTHFLAQEAQDLKGFIPGGNMWMTKAAIDHLITQQIFEALSPGYLNSIRQRTAKEYGQEWWWEPGETLPERPPNLDAALGE